MASRNPMYYLKRKGLEPTNRPRPRFSACDLLVHRYDTGFSDHKADLAEGDPAPERPRFKPWFPESSG